MNIKDPVRAAKALLGMVIEGVEVKKNGTVALTLNGGSMLIDFNECEIYIEVEEKQ